MLNYVCKILEGANIRVCQVDVAVALSIAVSQWITWTGFWPGIYIPGQWIIKYSMEDYIV